MLRYYVTVKVIMEICEKLGLCYLLMTNRKEGLHWERQHVAYILSDNVLNSKYEEFCQR
jgi:hypothetical protein